MLDSKPQPADRKDTDLETLLARNLTQYARHAMKVAPGPDCVVVTASGHEIACHKFALAHHSMFFRNMIADLPKDSKFTVEEDTQAILPLFNFMYSPHPFRFPGQHFAALLPLARKYDVPTLLQLCDSHMLNGISVTPQNFATYYPLAVEYGLKAAQASWRAWALRGSHFEAIDKSSGRDWMAGMSGAAVADLLFGRACDAERLARIVSHELTYAQFSLAVPPQPAVSQPQMFGTFGGAYQPASALGSAGTSPTAGATIKQQVDQIMERIREAGKTSGVDADLLALSTGQALLFGNTPPHPA